MILYYKYRNGNKIYNYGYGENSIMQIKKIYYGINPELLFDELKDFVERQGTVVY